MEAALAEIRTAVTTINDMNNQIASAAEQQTTVSETINQNVHQIVLIAGENRDRHRAGLTNYQTTGQSGNGAESAGWSVPNLTRQSQAQLNGCGLMATYLQRKGITEFQKYPNADPWLTAEFRHC